MTNDTGKVTTILVKFDNPEVGSKAKLTSPYRSRFIEAVPIAKHEAILLAKGERGSEVTRLQFPLSLAWVTTIHKVQGLTLDEIVVDMKGGRFSPGQAYVAFSRVKNFEGLHILSFNPKAIKASRDVKIEMERLSKNLLNPLPLFTCPSVSDDYITVALLNVRSIVPKIPDIHHDSSRVQIFCVSQKLG